MSNTYSFFKKGIAFLLIVLLAFSLLSMVTLPGLYVNSADKQYALYINGSRVSGASAYYINGTVYVPASVIGSKLKNGGISVDTAGKRLSINVAAQNLLLPDTSLSTFIKTNAPTAHILGKTIDSGLYFPLNPLKSFFKVKYTVTSNAVQITAAADKVKLAQINKNAVTAIPSLMPVSEPAEEAYIEESFAALPDDGEYGDNPDAATEETEESTAAPVVVAAPVQTNESLPQLTLYANDVVTILSTYDNYYKVELTDGTQAYIPKTDVTISDVNLANVDFYANKKTKSTPSGKLSINWEYVNLAQNGSTPATPATKLAGLDVLCPIWFAFTDAKGTVKNVGDRGYTDMAHAKGYKVWATVTNSFDGSMTTAVLGDKTLRNRVIAQYLFYSMLYDVDGINIDFEGVKDADGPKLTTFVSELRAHTEKLGLALSIDVMVPRSWNIEYEYSKLHKHVDYIAMMAYDEHYSGSKTPGPVASYPWVEDNINRILKEGVPASKVLLGVPTYTRAWTVDANNTVLKSTANSMMTIRDILKQKGATPTWLDDMKLYYVSYTDNGDLKKVWLEDARSISHKLNLVQKYNLAGAATWRRGFEEAGVWDVYAGMLKNGASLDSYQKDY